MSAFPRTRGIIFSELPLATQTQVDFEMLLLLVSSFFVDFLLKFTKSVDMGKHLSDDIIIELVGLVYSKTDFAGLPDL